MQRINNKNMISCLECKKMFDENSDEIMESGLNDNNFICEYCGSI